MSHSETPEELVTRAERLALEALEDPDKTPEYLEATAAARQLEWPNKRRSGMSTQNPRIIRYMEKNGHITRRAADIDLNVQSLSKRICEIQEMGFTIDKERVRNAVTGSEYVRYSIGGYPDNWVREWNRKRCA